jgi:eukaryotic-like serine/threonine-protein kinase
MPLTANTVFRFENCTIDPARRTCVCGEKPVGLTPRSFDLLLYLVTHSGRCIPKEELLSALWPDSFVEERNLSQHVFLLRKALAEDRLGERVIVTVPGRGYQFAARVDVQGGEDSGSAPVSLRAVESITTVVVEEHTETSPLLRRVLAALGRPASVGIAAALAALLAGGATVWYFRMHQATPVLRKVVLANFENRTADPIFDDSLQSGLRIELEQSPSIDLLSRNAVNRILAAMGKPANTPITGEVAREVCERANDQVLLTGSIARIGSEYLLALEATSCATGEAVAAEKAQASSPNAVIVAMDTITRRMRRELGETRRQIAAFQVPLFQATTPSLEALRAYSAAGIAFGRGDEKTTQALLEQAIQLDPGFMAAYNALAANYYNRGDFPQAAALYRKAFDLRGQTTERERLNVEINYYAFALHDDEDAIRRMRAFLDLYPNTLNIWSNMGNSYTQLGEYAESIDAAGHAVALDPHGRIARDNLARAYKDANRFAEAKRTAQAVFDDGQDAFGPNSTLMQVAFAEGDTAGMETTRERGLRGQYAYRTLDDLGFAAACQGRVREALDLLSRSRTESLRGGDADYAEGTLLDQAGMLVDLGEPARAVPYLKQIRGDAGYPAGLAEAWVEAGNPQLAEQYVTAAEPDAARNTIRVFHDVPLLNAELALRNHKALDAIAALEPARRYQLRDFEVPWVRARAEEQAGQMDAAAADYRLILANQGVDPLAPLYYRSHLELARILARQKRPADARAEYQAFLSAWSHADADLVLLQQARRELADLH